jgi:hypothetical protein
MLECDPFRVETRGPAVPGAMPPAIVYIPYGDILGLFYQLLRTLLVHGNFMYAPAIKEIQT